MRRAMRSGVLGAAVALCAVLPGCTLPDFLSSTEREASSPRLGTRLDPTWLGNDKGDATEVYAGKPLTQSLFEHFGVNPTLDTDEERVSAFAVDVDTASYTLTRSYLATGVLVPQAAVRVEEFVNSFDYEQPQPAERAVVGLSAVAFPSPTRPGYHVLALGLRTRAPVPGARKPLHLVLTVDGS